MTPTLAGRLQTRLVLLATIGLPVVLATATLVGPGPIGTRWRAGLTALLLTAVLGLAWELLYHALQQLRWDKDWPILFGLLTGIPEGWLVLLLLQRGVPWSVGEVDLAFFWTVFGATWLAVWLTAIGPLRVVAVRWRFRGGRFI